MYSSKWANRQIIWGGVGILIFWAVVAFVWSALATDSEAEVESAPPADLAATGASADPAVTEFVVPEPPFSDEEATDLLLLLTRQVFTNEPANVLSAVSSSGDDRFASVLIELMRAMEIGLVPGELYGEVIVSLQSLTDQGHERWPDWVVWYAGTELESPPGFAAWKGQLLSGIDEDFLQFFGDYPSRIRIEEIVWGGVAFDGIPALDNPTHIPAGTADYLTPQDLVFGVAIEGDARAYPLRIMDWHEMANDVVGGVPVSLAYCTLCGAGVLFDGRFGDETFTFGSSGFLMRSNKLMYDRTTRTLWNQLTGEPVYGPLADQDMSLARLPIVVTTWDEWVTSHPDTVVLDIETGFDRVYEPGAAYGDYFASEGTMFPAARTDLLDQKDRIFALLVDGVPAAYPTEIVVEEVVVNDVVGQTAVVVVAAGPELTGSGQDRRSQQFSVWDAGAEVRAFERGGRIFSAGVERDTVIDEEGTVWRVTEAGLVSPDDETLARLPGHLSYWFGWFSYFPNTQVYQG